MALTIEGAILDGAPCNVRIEGGTIADLGAEVTAAPGDYTLVVHDTDESDGEGVGTSQDTKRITVK